MHVQLERQVLGGGQGHARRRDALDGRVVGQVHEQHGALDGAGAAEVADEELGFLEGDAHGGEDDGELLVGPEHLAWRAICAASCGMRQAGAGEDRQLLPADQRVQPVDGRDAGLDELVRVVAGGRVDGRCR